jgi:hypothetical protein
MSHVLPRLLVLLNEWRLLLCHQCGRALEPTNVDAHLRKTPHGLGVRLRQNIVTYVAALHLPAPRDVAPRPDGGPPVPGLAVDKGFECTWRDCRQLHYISTSRCAARRHQRRFHTPGADHFGACHFQSFFAPFVVMQSDNHATSASPTAPALSEWQHWLAADEQAQWTGLYERLAPAEANA